MAAQVLLHRFVASSRQHPREKCARYSTREDRLIREYTPVDEALRYKSSDELVKPMVKPTGERRRPETHTDDMKIEPDGQFGLSVYSWNDKLHHPRLASSYKECFNTPLGNLKEHGLQATFTGEKRIGRIDAIHYVIRPKYRMTLGEFDRLWQGVEWYLCDMKGAGEKDDFWFPRPGFTPMLSLEGILHLAVVYLGREDPNDLSAVDLYSRVRSDEIKSLNDVVQCGLGEVCVQLLEFVVAVEEKKCDDEESAEDSCEVVLDGKSLLHFLKEEISKELATEVENEETTGVENEENVPLLCQQHYVQVYRTHM